MDSLVQRFAGMALGARPTRGNSVRRPPRRPHASQQGPRRASTGLANFLPTRGPTLRAATPQDAVYFDEGQGYLLVRSVGSGADGSASLVRSVRNGKLYIRKEDTYFLAFYGETATFRESPPDEIANARLVDNVNGVYHAHGWTKWVNRNRHRSYNVTYWKYYDLGALTPFNTAFRRNNGRPVPEEWCVTWLIRMSEILINVHDAGIVHHDCHGGNWLLETGMSTIPRIVLADFGRCERRPSDPYNPHAWIAACTSDFSLSLEAICHCLNLNYNYRDGTVRAQAGPQTSLAMLNLCKRMALTLHRTAQSITSLHSRVRLVCNALRELREQYANFHGQTIRMPVQSAEPEYMTGQETIQRNVVNKPASFKQWRKALVTGNSVVTSTQSGLDVSQNYRGEWYVDFGNGDALYTVDGRR